jgi:hypothetical protein
LGQASPSPGPFFWTQFWTQTPKYWLKRSDTSCTCRH